jgi:hypothetical protein
MAIFSLVAVIWSMLMAASREFLIQPRFEVMMKAISEWMIRRLFKQPKQPILEHPDSSRMSFKEGQTTVVVLGSSTEAENGAEYYRQPKQQFVA